MERVLLRGAAEHSWHKRSRKINRSVKASETPLRITETRYIRRKHDEIGDELIGKNEKVVSLANCDACHTKAAEGSFDDDQVNIPGYGTWTTWSIFK